MHSNVSSSKNAALSRGAKRNRDLRSQADEIGLRQITITVPGRDYKSIWRELGPEKTNLRFAIQAERAFQKAAQAKRGEQEGEQPDLPGIGGAP